MQRSLRKGLMAIIFSFVSISVFAVVAIAAPNPFLHNPTAVLPLQAATHVAGGHKPTRLFNHHLYEVVDTAFFVVYHGYKTVEKIPNKGVMTVSQYYFSKTPSSEIYELSIANLEKAFPENYRFHYALEEEFKSDRSLMAYDNYLHEYKVKYLFSASLK